MCPQRGVELVKVARGVQLDHLVVQRVKRYKRPFLDQFGGFYTTVLKVGAGPRRDLC